jgi:hypothetical protein
MRLQQAKSIARHLGLTLRELCSGDYRVNFRDGNETTAYYTDNLDDAVNAAAEMARMRAPGLFFGPLAKRNAENLLREPTPAIGTLNIGGN